MPKISGLYGLTPLSTTLLAAMDRQRESCAGRPSVVVLADWIRTVWTVEAQ